MIIRSSGKDWGIAKRRLIEKGGYLWYLGASAIRLNNMHDRDIIIPFKKPIEEFSKKILPADEVKLSTYLGKSAGINIEIWGDVIQFK